MSKLLIYGAPGVGKSSTSRILSRQTNIKLFEGDYLREHVAQKDKTEAEDPFLYVGTKEAWHKFGELSENNVIRGLLAVRNSMRPYVKDELSKHVDVIFEVAFLTPQDYNRLHPMFLLVTLDEERHRKQFFATRPVSDETENRFRASRIIQDYLLHEASSLHVNVIYNDCSPDVVSTYIAEQVQDLVS